MATGPFSESDEKIAFISVGHSEESDLINLNETLRKSLKNRQFKITNNIIEAANYSNIVILTELGITKKKDLIETRQKLLLQKKLVLGIITLNKINLKT